MSTSRQLRQIERAAAAFLLAMLVSGLILLILGHNPIEAYGHILSIFRAPTSIGNAIANATPLALAGLAVSVSGRAGILNLGVEGQLYIGGMCGTLVGLFLPTDSKGIMIPLVLIAAVLGGMLWAGLVGVLRARFDINEVIVALMLNYVASLFTSYLVAGPLKEPASGVNRTAFIRDSAKLTRFIPRTQVTAALFIACILAVILWYLFKYTIPGFKMKCIGANPRAATSYGINHRRYIVISMMLSGGIAGLVGITEIMGKYYRFTEDFSGGIGFTGVAIAALAGYNPFAVLIVSLLFGVLNAGSMVLGREMGVSSKLFMVMEGVIILFVATPYLIDLIRKLFGRKSGRI